MGTVHSPKLGLQRDIGVKTVSAVLATCCSAVFWPFGPFYDACEDFYWIYKSAVLRRWLLELRGRKS